MRDRGLLLVLLASALTFLASLYLPWETAPQVPVAPNGWQPWFGQAAGLVALALAGGAAAAVARPDLRARLPLARGAFLLGYLALSVWAELRGLGMFEQSALPHGTVQYGSGAYLGLASAFVAVLAVEALRRDEFSLPAPLTAAGVLLSVGLLAAFLLPAVHMHVAPHSSAASFVLAFSRDIATIFAAGVAVFGVPAWANAGRVRERLSVAAATAVLTGGTLSLEGRWTSYSWLALGCSLGLVALALAESSGVRLAVPRWTVLTTPSSAVLVIAAMFLPWEQGCSGWEFPFSAIAGGLAVLLIALVLVAAGAFAIELALGAAVLLLAAGFTLTEFTSLAYGAYLGFAGTAGLLLSLGAERRPVQADRRLLRLAAAAACLAFVAIAVVPLTGRLSARLELEAPWRLLWLQIAAVLVALRLLGRWLVDTRSDHKLVVLPLGLLSLTALDLIYTRDEGFGWGDGIVLGLCLFLVALAGVTAYRARTDGSASTTSLATRP